MTTDKSEIDRALALAVAELRRHGGSERDVETLSAQFKVVADDKADSENKIPD